MVRSIVSWFIQAREETGRVAETAVAVPQISAIRDLARNHGFRRLGVMSERPLFQGIVLYIDVWARDDVFLSIVGPFGNAVSAGYHFTTTFDDDLVLLTWDKEKCQTKDTDLVSCHTTEGSFAKDLRAHLRRVDEREAEGARALPAESLTQRVAEVRDFYRDKAAFSNIYPPALLFLTLLVMCGVFTSYMAQFGAVLGSFAAAAPFLMTLSGGVIQHLSLWYQARTLLDRDEDVSDVSVTPLTQGLRCPYCHDAVFQGEGVVCASCVAQHHTECWDAHGQCSTCHSTLRFQGVERTRGREVREPTWKVA